MKAYTINKENWTGEKGTYRTKGNKVIVGKTEYTLLTEKNTELGTEWIEVTSEDTVSYNITKLPSGIYEATVLGVERESKIPAEVVARLHWNLVDGETRTEKLI
jgi:hypothetical protein